MKREKSAGAVIFSRGGGTVEYLLLHYPSKRHGGGHWDYPKGHVEKGEKEMETVRREVAEETGLKDISCEDGFCELISYFFTDGSRKVHKNVVFFLAETPTKDVRLSSEHTGYAWLSYEEALERLTFKNAKEVLIKAHEYLIKKGVV